MVDAEQITVAKQIQRETGPTFHVATRFLPPRVRQPTYVLYAFFRKADQVVDDPDPGPAREQAARLDQFERAALGEEPTDDPVLTATAELVDEYDIDEAEVTEFIGAMKQDIHVTEYASFADLEGYLRGSAVAVAYMMLQVMEPGATDARPHAKALGEAFQLTNFLRDVREDAREYDRVYLPVETLEMYGLGPSNVRDRECSESVGHVIRTELSRAEERYREGVAGIELLPADCQFPVLLSAVLYAEYHRLIADLEYDVVNERPNIPTSRHISLVLRTWIEWKRRGDPEAVFYRVSPVEPPTDHTLSSTREPPNGVVGSVSRVTRSVRSYLSASGRE